ncbi:MAG TPA: S8 family serine peptidase [Sedimentisphaerales bacterium]|nr:S8 family serine peptidase [Sedimentisphaerales bacterium]
MLRFRSNYPLTTLIVLWATAIFAARPPTPAPPFSLTDIAGKTVSLSELQGQNVLLVFGTTQCPHCEDAIPIIEDFCVAAKGEIVVFFVAVRQDDAQVADFFAGRTPSFGVLLDQTGAVSRSYDIKRIPTSVFIDAQGLVQYVGRVDENIFWRLLSGERPLYADSPPPQIDPAKIFANRARPDPGPNTRFIVELDEKPKFSKKLSGAAVQSRRKQFNKAVEALGGRIIHNYGTWENRIVVEVPPANVDRLADLPHFKSYKPDRRVYALLEDSAYQIKADYAWDNAITGEGVKVCVVDTGIDYTHPDLQNKVVAQYNFTNYTTDAMDDHGHGTHCAGIIASEGLVYRGVSHDVALMAAKVLDYTGAGYASDVALGINWCVEQGADVISLSLGEGLYSGTCDFEEMAHAVNHAVDPCGVVVACAAGNDGDSSRMVAPACASKAIAVGAVDKVDNIASYSDGGSELDLVAPGGDLLGGKNYAEIVSTFSTAVAEDPYYCMYLIADECYDNYFVVDGTRYIRAEGTSMATPHVAGAAALLLEANPNLTPEQIKTVLEENADDLGAPGWDNIFGWGRINLERAIENVPPDLGELKVTITEPNANDTFAVGQEFTLASTVDCFGGDGCGEVLVYAQYCEGLDCNDFTDINSATPVSTLDNNPNNLGILSGYTVETDVPVIFDANTTLDISEAAYTKSINPESSLIGSTLPAQYNTGDLEPQDGVGAVYENAQAHYEFQIPSGTVKTLKVRMENYLVLNFYYPPYVGWYVYTSNAGGDNLHLVGDCIPPEGGGGETPPPDCWWISDDPNVIADLDPGGTSYIKLVSHDVDEFEYLTFNDIEVIVEYEIDPDNDEVHEYYVKFDINSIDPADELTAARLKINVTQGAPDCLADLYLVDNTLSSADPAQLLHEANAPAYSSLTNPIKSFSCENPSVVSLNVKAALDEALAAGQDSIAFQIAERNNDQLARIDANNGTTPPTLTISQKVLQLPGQPPEGQTPDANNGPRTLVYDTDIVKDVTDDTYLKDDNPGAAVIGAPFDSEYNTGDLEPNDGLGAIYENAEKLYEFQIPAGQLSRIKVRMENYLVVNFWYPPYVGWYVYSSNANGDNLHIIGDCVPPEGGGGELPPPDCWFISDDPAVLADLNPGGTSYIKLVSHDVDEFEYLTFNDIEVIAEYQLDPNNDSINRYYVKFDVSTLPAGAEVDSATLNVYVTEPNVDATAEIHLVKSTYDACTPGYMIYNAEDADYSSLTNPIKTFACDSTGLRQVNVKPAVEDALAAGVPNIAFLIKEQNENDLFAIDANAGSYPPSLNVYLKSQSTSGLAQWNILPAENGLFTIRVKATNNVGVTGLSDHLVVDVFDANLPVINNIDCMINSTWQDCRNAQYGDNLQQIRIDATDLQETPTVWLKLRNVPDDHNFVDNAVTYSAGYFTYNTNLTIADSGQWQINVTAADSDDNTDVETINWNIPWGRLDSYLISPTSDFTAPKNSSFTVQAGVQCLDAECPDVNIGLSLNVPKELKYDDATAEDYGDIGSTDGYLAVKITPTTYPTQLITARFYVWDETTYPFELHVWDDDGSGGMPNTNLVTPFVVDPVVTSPAGEVAWFDINLLDHNIIINSGSFYIGWRQLQGTQNNQVGFDTTGTAYTRSYGYLPSQGWFNLDYYCQLCWLLPELCDFCGNLMIRAMVSEPGAYAGDLPQTIGPAILYTTDEHPVPCTNPDMDPGQTCQATINVHAVGPAGEYTRFYARAANNYSADSAGPIKVTITPPLTPCDAANLDAIYPVGYGDIRILADQWLESTPPLFADVNGDGDVNFKDFAKIAQYWLQSCN